MSDRNRCFMRKLAEAALLLILAGVLTFAGRVVFDAWFAASRAEVVVEAPVDSMTQKLDNVEAKLDALLALPPAARDGV